MADEITSLQPINERTELAQVIEDIMSPVLGALAQLVGQNVKALEELSASQRVINERMEALEKQIRLNTPVSPTQVKYINGAMKKRAVELLEAWTDTESGYNPAQNTKCVNKVVKRIKTDVLSRYGTSNLNEIPRHEYTVVMTQISSFNDRIFVRQAARDARTEQV